jgi:regulatory protein
VDAELEAAREIALRRLESRARSRAELESDLAARGVRADVAARLLDRLTEVGLVDDAEFARLWVEQRRGLKGLGTVRLREELRAKGVAEETITAALADGDGADDDDRAFAFARKRAALLTGLDRVTFQRRLAGQLARRGFPEPVVRRVVFALADELLG